MKISARNTLKGTVKEIKLGGVEAEVTLSLPGGTEIVATISRASVESLGLVEGKEAFALIKASSVMVGVD